MWVRGLKLGAKTKIPDSRKMSHPVWVRGLKQHDYNARNDPKLSHPVWVRGLKLIKIAPSVATNQSHPVWVRGLKLHS